MSLPWSPRRPQTLMCKGLKARERESLSLPSPSRFWLLSLTLLFLWQNLSEKEVLKRRFFAYLQTAKIYCIFAVGKLASWITQETHHEKQAKTIFINYSPHLQQRHA